MLDKSPVVAVNAAIRFLSQPAIPFIILPALMLLLVVGTIAQAEMGLYAAQEKFFASFIFWAGPIPLPGGYTLMGIFTLNLLLKFLFFSTWSWTKSGIILTHLGTLVLLFGGLATSLSAREGFMVINEGAQTPFVYDYHRRDLMIYENDRLLYAIPADIIEAELAGQSLTLPFQIKIHEFCRNCAISKRDETDQAFAQGQTPQSLAQFMALSPKAEDKDNEVNMPGFSFSIETSQNDTDINGLYIAFDGMPKPIEFETGGKNYKMIFGKQQRSLPFQLKLIDFRKKNYPGLDQAKAFESDVIVLDESSEWKAHIEMNAPLRYKGYTFYQSDFEEGAGGDITILTVVKNQGRFFPYIGTGIIALGLLIHAYLMLKKRDKIA
jgi:hypothetical protein